MISSLLMPIWNELGAGLANHIWQSTLCMVVLGALTLLFKRNSAVVRYRLWLIASVKFLVPFSIFVGLGGLLQWHPDRPVTPSAVPIVVRQISQPFTTSPITIPAQPIAKAAPVAKSSLGIAFVSAWFGGAVIVLLVWFVRWVQLVRIVRRAKPLDASNPWVPSYSESLRLRILSSPVATEPGVFGIVSPALLLPENIARNLNDAQLHAVIAHEMFHVRGRDNLAAAMHTIVQALFWFHPLVWWLGNRLVDERERACDEAVLQSGHDPADYAEGILKVCKSNLMMPACVAGVSGSNLKKRIEVIMENRGTRSLTPGKKVLLTVAGTGVLIVPIFAGMMSASQSPAVAVREMQLPALSQPALSQPVLAQPVLAQPALSQPVLAQPILSQPALLQVPTPSARQTPPAPAVQAEPQPSAIRVNALPVIENGTITMLPVLSLAAVPSPQQAPAPPAVSAVTGQQKWLDDVSIILTDAERKAFQQLTTDEQRQDFIKKFWLDRDPTPGTPANEFKSEYDRRVAYANEHFTTQSGIPGSQTDRGKMYTLNGPPDEIVSHPSGGTYYRPTAEGRGVTNTSPFETWRYRLLNGKAENVIYEFVDKQMNGNYSLEYDPGSKTK